MKENDVNQQDFNPGRQQDAWATLRGFKYQIDLSILRWLELPADSYLELERGEDIDQIAQSIVRDNDSTFHRVLEQVKHRDSSITLRSEETLEFICNAISHVEENPTLRLWFCYSTNARIVAERPNPFPNRTPGLQLWEDCRDGYIAGDERRIACQSIGQFLLTLSRPKNISVDNWGRLKAIASNDLGMLEDLISRLQWNCGGPNAEDASERVRHSIREIVGQGDRGDRQVESLHQRLTFFVLGLLSRSGIKRLSREMLSEQLSKPTLSDSDYAQLQTLQDRFTRLQFRVEGVEDAVSVLKSHVGRVAKKVGIELQDIDPMGAVSTEPPPMAINLVKRTRIVNELLENVRSPAWLAVVGALDEGKSHLARELADQLGGCAGWVQFNHAMEPMHAVMVLREAIRHLGAHSSPTVDTDLFRLAISKLKRPCCVVLDDMPRLTPDSPLLSQLSLLGKTCHGNGVYLVSTSRFNAPHKLLSSLRDEHFKEISVPRFDELEIADLLRSYGAPKWFLDQTKVRFICNITFGHPLLSNIAIKYLRDANWESGRLTDILDQQHTAGIADEVLVRLCTTLGESERELLYRMSLAICPLHDDVAIELGKVETEIPRPRETLASLIGAWVQRETPRTSRVSPILVGLAKPNLPAKTFRDCHSVLAASILRKPISPWDAQEALTHLLLADQTNHAALLFHSLLERLHTWAMQPELRPLLTIWKSSPLPANMYAGLKLIVRSLQSIVLHKYGESDQFVLQDLDRLMDDLSDVDELGPYVVSSFALLFLSERDFARSVKYYRIAMHAIASGNVDLSEFHLPEEKNPAESLWHPIQFIRSETDLRLWQDAFDSLTTTQQQAVIDSPNATLGGIVLADRLMMIESEKESADCDWSNALSGIERLQDWSAKRKWEYLEACALKARVNIHGERLREPESIADEVYVFCNDEKRSVSSRSIVSGMYGRELAGVSRYEKAIPWLAYANRFPVDGAGHNQLMSYLAAVLCFGSLKRFDEADEVGKRALDLVERNEAIDHVEAMKAYGEVTIASLRLAVSKDAALSVFPIWNNAVRRMFAAEVRDDNWKDSFVVFSHVHSFLVTVATTGKMAEFACDGSEYVPPFLGMFFRSSKERIELFSEESIPSIMWMHHVYARAAGDLVSSEEWLLKADQAIAQGPLTYTNAPIRGDMVSYFLNDGKYAEALDAAFESARSMVAVKCYYEKYQVAIPHGTTVDSLVQQLDEGGLQLTDPFGIINGVIPAFFRIALSAFADPIIAAEKTAEVAAICKQIAPSAYAPSVWLQASSLFERFGAVLSENALIAISDYSCDCREIQILSYFAATFNQDLQTAFTAHVIGLSHADSWYGDNSAIYRMLFSPFIEQFWRAAFSKRRFEFSSPRIVEQDFQDLVSLSSAEMPRAILRAVSSSFHARDTGDCIDSLRR